MGDSSIRILFWGNNADFASSVSRLLTRRGYQVTTVASGRDMLGEIHEHCFDVMLIDGRSSLNEIGLSREVAKMKPDLPVILIYDDSSGSTVTDREFFDYLREPFGDGELLMRLVRAIEFGRLRASENLYRLLYENAAEGIYLSTPEGKYTHCNIALSRLLGYGSPEELKEALNNEGCGVHPDSALRRRITRLMQKREVLSGIESQARRQDGTPVWISENVRAVRNAEGALICLRGTVEDIGLRRKSEEQLRESERYHKLQFENAEKNRAVFLDIIDDVYKSYQNLDELFVNSMAALAGAIDERTRWRKGHSERVASYTAKIAKAMCLHKEDMHTLHLAALLHDIGQLTVSDDILGRPAKLSDTEFRSIKSHPVQGVAMLRKVPQMKHIIPIIRHHHERPDGCGYPDGLRGDEIPMGAKILHLADSFDSMTAGRPYRPSRGRAYALREVERWKNTQFDPEVAAVALKVL